MTAAALAEGLLASARALETAVASDDAEALLAATEARTTAFDALRAVVGDAPPQGLRGVLREVRAIDERILARTPALKDGIRRERELLGVARDAARAVRQKDAPRFLDLRA